jgi:EAL domain-containing protein (putative c-di-GMP-specific phosphodiesterase class I)
MEETGLIVGLGHWILEEVCRQLAEWGPRVVSVSINLSDREFWHRGLLPDILEVVQRHGLTTDRLTLEVTEGVLMRHPEMALRMMHELHEAGLRLHIDDFGTGYSSLETLHRFPVDAFKIDRSFLRSLATGDHTTELMTALVGLGSSLGLAVVAEGVETDDQLTFLKSIGCATGQGYLFMPAVDRDQASALLDRNLAPVDRDLSATVEH